jgi:hypothetical protein
VVAVETEEILNLKDWASKGTAANWYLLALFWSGKGAQSFILAQMLELEKIIHFLQKLTVLYLLAKKVEI